MMKSIEKSLRNLTFLFIGGFSLYMLITTLVATVRQLNLTERDDNPRRVEIEKRVQRGSILDRHGTVLAFSSSSTPRGYQTRTYPDPASYSFLGYASYQYGVNRIEARYDSVLMNEAERQPLAKSSLLNLREGTDIQLTLDATWQSTLYDLMKGHVGAGVLQSAQNGQVLAWLSLPSIDPNTLDENWESLLNAENDPFFDRVAQGNYQLGGMIHLPLMVSALIQQINMTTEYEQADQPIQVDRLPLGCLAPPPDDTTLTLLEAFYWGCPAPFVAALTQTYPQPLISELELLQLHERIQPFDPPYVTTPIPRRLVELSPQRLTHTLTGQGTLTTSPLHMNRLMSAILHNGNAYEATFLLATKQDEQWQLVNQIQPSRAYLSSENAVFIRTQLNQSLQQGALQSLDWSFGAEVGGIGGIGHGGNSSYVWFSGYMVTNNINPLSLTLIIEDETNPMVVAQIARDFFASIHRDAPSS